MWININERENKSITILSFHYYFCNFLSTASSWWAQRAAVTTWWAMESETASLPTCPFLGNETLHRWEPPAGGKRVNLCMLSLRTATEPLTMRTSRDSSGVQRMKYLQVKGSRGHPSQQHPKLSKCAIASNVSTWSTLTITQIAWALTLWHS